jgi:hypothetical protein
MRRPPAFLGVVGVAATLKAAVRNSRPSKIWREPRPRSLQRPSVSIASCTAGRSDTRFIKAVMFG